MSDDRIERIERLVKRIGDLTAFRPETWHDVDLTLSQLKAVFLLKDSQPRTLTEFAFTLGISLTSASALVERLVRLKMVGRSTDASDRRQVRIELSPDGAILIDRLERQSRGEMLAALCRMSETGISSLEAGLTELLAAVRVSQDATSVQPESSPAAAESPVGSADRRRGLLDQSTRENLLTLYALRSIERCGPLSGNEELAILMPIARLLRTREPSLPFLHDLERRGHLVADESRPPRYQLSEVGQREASRLASILRPVAQASLARVERQVEALIRSR